MKKMGERKKEASWLSFTRQSFWTICISMALHSFPSNVYGLDNSTPAAKDSTTTTIISGSNTTIPAKDSTTTTIISGSNTTIPAKDPTTTTNIPGSDAPIKGSTATTNTRSSDTTPNKR